MLKRELIMWLQNLKYVPFMFLMLYVCMYIDSTYDTFYTHNILNSHGFGLIVVMKYEMELKLKKRMKRKE